jgi:hypothetical protein
MEKRLERGYMLRLHFAPRPGHQSLLRLSDYWYV